MGSSEGSTVAGVVVVSSTCNESAAFRFLLFPSPDPFAPPPPFPPPNDNAERALGSMGSLLIGL